MEENFSQSNCVFEEKVLSFSLSLSFSLFMKNCITTAEGSLTPVVLHLPAEGEALCNLALISLSGRQKEEKKKDNTKQMKETRFYGKKVRWSINNDGGVLNTSTFTPPS